MAPGKQRTIAYITAAVLLLVTVLSTSGIGRVLAQTAGVIEEIEKTARPEVVTPGGTSTVALSFDALPCEPPYLNNVSVALVIDQSGSMRGQPLRDAQEAAKRFIDNLQPGDQVSVVSYSDFADRQSQLTTDFDSAKQSIDRLSDLNNTNIAAGLEEGFETLRAAPVDDSLVLILLTDGRPNRPGIPTQARAAALRAANNIKAAGVDLFTIGFAGTGGLDEDLMREMASSPDQYRQTPSGDELAEIYASIARGFVRTTVIGTDVTIVERFDASRFEVLSAGDGGVIDETSGTITWSLAQITNSDSLSYRVRPTYDSGQFPASLSTEMVYTSATGCARQGEVINVTTGEGAFVTVDNSIGGICVPSSGRLDVVFLMDTTYSMNRVIATVQTEVNQITSELQARVPDTAFGLATFSDYPGIYGVPRDVPYAVQQTLTTDIVLFQSAVNGISTFFGSGGDGPEAYGRALDEVVSFNWRDDARRVVVLVGDTVPHTERTVYGDGRPDPGRDGIIGTSDDISFVEAINRTRVNEITVVGLLADTASTTPKAEKFFGFITENKYERIPATPISTSLLDSILVLTNRAVCTPADSSRAIVLERFTATPVAGGIEVRWVTSSEINTWGFHLLRSADGTRESAERITPELIPAEGRGQAGASYTWLDTDVEPGITYTYWLEETETDGTVIEYGTSVWSQPGTNATNHSIHLPIIIR